MFRGGQIFFAHAKGAEFFLVENLPSLKPKKNTYILFFWRTPCHFASLAVCPSYLFWVFARKRSVRPSLINSLFLVIFLVENLPSLHPKKNTHILFFGGPPSHIFVTPPNPPYFIDTPRLLGARLCRVQQRAIGVITSLEMFICVSVISRRMSVDWLLIIL